MDDEPRREKATKEESRKATKDGKNAKDRDRSKHKAPVDGKSSSKAAVDDSEKKPREKAAADGDNPKTGAGESFAELFRKRQARAWHEDDIQ